MKPKLVKYKGRVLKVLTIGQLAEMVFRKPDSLRKMEDNQQLPMPNLRDVKTADGGLGKRLYTVNLAEELVPLFKRIEVGKKMPDELIRDFTLAFQREKEFINSPITPNASGS